MNSEVLYSPVYLQSGTVTEKDYEQLVLKLYEIEVIAGLNYVS